MLSHNSYSEHCNQSCRSSSRKPFSDSLERSACYEQVRGSVGLASSSFTTSCWLPLAFVHIDRGNVCFRVGDLVQRLRRLVLWVSEDLGIALGFSINIAIYLESVQIVFFRPSDLTSQRRVAVHVHG